MFEEWKEAWRAAVENFYRELNDGGDAVEPRRLAMQRDLDAAAVELQRLGRELERARRAAEDEAHERDVCQRRLAMAEKIGDAETARVARHYAERHIERYAVMVRTAEALEAEHAMRAADLDEMRAALEKTGDASRDPLEAANPDAAREAQGRQFRNLDREARERAAEARLEELKRRMG